MARPFPWRALLAYLAPRLTPGWESVDGARYRRRIGDDAVEVSLAADGAALRIAGASAAAARERIAALFAVDFDGAPAAAVLARDPLLRARLAAVPGMRPLGAFAPFELCVRTIVGQQVTVAGAGTLMRRLVERCGGALTPEAVTGADLAAIGMPGRRAECLRALAAAVAGGRVDLAAPWRALDAALGALPGIGPWTRAYLGIRLGRDPDAFPAGDLGLQRAAGAASAGALAARAEAWRPHRALAATLLWSVPARGAGSG